MVIDLTPVRDGVGPARLLDMVPGRSEQAFATWLAAQPVVFRDGLEVVAMDGFTGFTTATTEQLPDAVAVMDPFHVARLAGDALDRCQRRVQQDLHGHRGVKGDPLYQARRTLHTGADLLTDRQRARIAALFAEDHVAVEVTLGVYQAVIAAYRHLDRATGRAIMTKLIAEVSRGVPTAPAEVTTPGRTPTRRATDVLAYFDRPGRSNGPTEAINGRPIRAADPYTQPGGGRGEDDGPAVGDGVLVVSGLRGGGDGRCCRVGVGVGVGVGRTVSEESAAEHPGWDHAQGVQDDVAQ